MDRGMNMRAGINYCAPVGEIGFRGVNSKSTIARLIPLSELSRQKEEMFFFHGVDVSAAMLPYLPDMDPDSAFAKKGSWHHYKITSRVFIFHLQPQVEVEGGRFAMNHVLHAVAFEGEEKPRVFVDRRTVLVGEGVLAEADLRRVDEILAAKQVVLV